MMTLDNQHITAVEKAHFTDDQNLTVLQKHKLD